MANMTFRTLPALLSVALIACSQSGDDANWTKYTCGPLHKAGGLRWSPDESESIQVFAANNEKIQEWALEIRIHPERMRMRVRSPADPHHPRGQRNYRIIHNGRTQLTAVYGRQDPVELYTLYSGGKLVYVTHSNWDIDALDYPTVGGYAGTYYADCEKTAPGENKQRLTRVLFLCSQNRLRSPTAEAIFADREGLEVRSAGLDHDAVSPLTHELVQWAEIIFVMERVHGNKLRKKFRRSLDTQRIICLGIPDEYAYMDPALISRLRAQVPRHL